MKWLKGRKAIAILLAVALVWIVYRIFRGVGAYGHVSPADAIASGWTVYQAGITGWLEVAPDGKTNYMHDSGWTVDPYTTNT
jgi:hypothetical protein